MTPEIGTPGISYRVLNDTVNSPYLASENEVIKEAMIRYYREGHLQDEVDWEFNIEEAIEYLFDFGYEISVC